MNESADTIKYLIKQFIDEVADNTIILADGKKNVGSRVNKFVFDLESFFIKLRREYKLNDRIDTSILSNSILQNFSSIAAKDAYRAVDYQFNFLQLLAREYLPELDLFKLIDIFIEKFKSEFTLADIVVTASGATRCKTNLRFALNDLRDLGFVISKDVNEKRSFSPSIMGLVVLLNIRIYENDFSTMPGYKNYNSLSPISSFGRSLPSFYSYDPILIASLNRLETADHLYDYLHKHERVSLNSEEKKVLNEIIAIYLEFINENLEITYSGIKAGNSFKEKTKVFQKKIFSYELNNSKFHSMLFKHFRS